MSNPNHPFEGFAIQDVEDAPEPKGYVTQMPGGTTRYNVGPKVDHLTFQKDKPEEAIITTAFTGQSLRVDSQRDGVSDAAVTELTKFVPSEQDNQLPGILSTGKSGLTGLRISSANDINDRTVFTVHGIEMDAAGAARAGFLVKDDNGHYSLPNGEAAKAPLKQDDEPTLVDHLSERVRGTLENIDAITDSAGMTDAVVARALPHAISGDFDKAAQALTQATGLDPEHAREAVEFVFNDTIRTASDYITANHGVDGMEVFRWAGENMRSAERASMAHRIYCGDRAAFTDIVARYKRAAMIKYHSTKTR